MFFKKKIVNETFGKLVLDYNWRRDVTYKLWGKEFQIKLTVESSSAEHEILKIQEEAYKTFLSHISQLEKSVKSYFLDNYDDIVEYYYIDFGTSWGTTAGEKKQLQKIIDSYGNPEKDAIDDMLSHIGISSISVEESGRIIIELYVNIPDGHGLLVVIDSDIKILTHEEFDDTYEY